MFACRFVWLLHSARVARPNPGGEVRRKHAMASRKETCSRRAFCGNIEQTLPSFRGLTWQQASSSLFSGNRSQHKDSGRAIQGVWFNEYTAPFAATGLHSITCRHGRRRWRCRCRCRRQVSARRLSGKPRGSKRLAAISKTWAHSTQSCTQLSRFLTGLLKQRQSGPSETGVFTSKMMLGQCSQDLG